MMQIVNIVENDFLIILCQIFSVSEKLLFLYMFEINEKIIT